MSPEYEFEGKTKEDAVKTACDELGLSEDELDAEVLSYGSTGIFGLVGAKKAKIRVTVPEPPEVDVGQPSDAEAGDHDQVIEMAKNAVERIVSSIVDGASVAVEAERDTVKLLVEGGNSAILIGKHGRTLDAIQYIVQKIAYKKRNTRLRISVDVEGYRDRRKASLTQLALRLGEKVKRSGKPATVSPMNAYDRRIIHIALKDDNGVRTQSMGNRSFRKLVIYPQRKHK